MLELQTRAIARTGIDVTMSNKMGDSLISEQRRRKKLTGKSERVPLAMATKTIDNIIYPVQTKRGLKWGKANI